MVVVSSEGHVFIYGKYSKYKFDFFPFFLSWKSRLFSAFFLGFTLQKMHHWNRLFFFCYPVSCWVCWVQNDDFNFFSPMCWCFYCLFSVLVFNGDRLVGLRLLLPSRHIAGPLGRFGSAVFFNLVVEDVWLEPVGNTDGGVFMLVRFLLKIW